MVNLTFEVVKEPLPPTGAIVGLNRGVASTLATSEGKHIQGTLPDAKRRRKLQRQLSRAEKGSKKRQKKLAVYSNFRYRETLAKRNELHRITSKLVADHDFIVMEDFDIPAMTRSGRGTLENPGTNVALRTWLNRSILEQGWGMIQMQLAYKAEWAGRRLAKVSPQFISQDCSSCGQRRSGPFPNRIYPMSKLWFEVKPRHQCGHQRPAPGPSSGGSGNLWSRRTGGRLTTGGIPPVCVGVPSCT